MNFFFLFLVLPCVVSSIVIETENFTIWTVPDNAVDVEVKGTKPGVAMIGGGEDCVPAFSYLIENAAFGDFVILRAGGTDDYNQFVYDLSVSLNKTLNSVTTISWKNREASFDNTVLDVLSHAESIFFAGGDQSLYVQYWSDTPVQSIVQSKLENGVSIGGTSAGLAIQGEYIFTGANGSVFSGNSYNFLFSFVTGFE
jgi:cyanophycinase